MRLPPQALTILICIIFGQTFKDALEIKLAKG